MRQLMSVDVSQDFRAWLEKQPLERTFRYMDLCGCAAASYAKEVFGWINPQAGGCVVSNMDSNETVQMEYEVHQTLANLGKTFTVADLLKQFPAQ